MKAHWMFALTLAAAPAPLLAQVVAPPAATVEQRVARERAEHARHRVQHARRHVVRARERAVHARHPPPLPAAMPGPPFAATSRLPRATPSTPAATSWLRAPSTPAVTP